ncbi:MAG: helix-turn-helix transcriptional regulator, partial [Steroidobacteraceae bacterium]
MKKRRATTSSQAGSGAAPRDSRASDRMFRNNSPGLSVSGDETARAFERLAERTERLSPLDLTSVRNHPLALGVRHFLTESDGSGYWEYFKPSDHLLLSVTDATYRRTQWIEIPRARLLKLRLLLSGQLLGPDRETILAGPQAHLHLSSGENAEGYFVAGGVETKLIVLHCAVEFLEDRLHLNSSELPPPVDAMLHAGSASSTQRLGFSAEVLHAAQRILDSRHGIPSALRCAYLDSVATTILCEVFGELSNQDLARHSAWQARDLNRIYEARDYLAQHFIAPPTIPQLARMVGINQTKLKAGFKQVLGLTIYQYILERRMTIASELLRERDHNVTEIAYRVG